jgi:WD40 repeat protein
MSLDGGLGAVTSKFNALKPPPNCEMLTAVRSSDGEAYWLIGHEFGNDHFFVFRIDSDGISPDPVTQAIGPVIGTPQAGVPASSHFDAIGTLRASTDGSRLAFTTLYNGITALFDFDASTGSVSNPVVLDIGQGGYGASFSPDGSKLYITSRDSSNYTTFMNASLLQFDISSGDSSTIQASMSTIYSTAVGGFAALKLGPDGRIYVARAGADGTAQGDEYLGVVNMPDQPGIACGYIHDGIYLNGQHGSWSLNNLFETGNSCSAIHEAVEEHAEATAVTITTRADRIELAWPEWMLFDQVRIRSSDGREVFSNLVPQNARTTSFTTAKLNSGVFLATLSSPSLSVTRGFCVMDH